MARVPVITSPCPLRFTSMPRAGLDHCGQCDRQVHNLDGMSTLQRETFMRSCSGKTCVAYTVQRQVARRGVALGAGLLAAMAGSGALAATPDDGAAASAPIEVSAQTATQATEEYEDTTDFMDIVVTGGTVDADGTVRWADESEVDTEAAAELPTIGAADWLPSRTP